MAPPMQVGSSDRTAKASALGETFIDVREQISRLAGRVKDGLGELNRFAGDVKEFFTKERQDGKVSQLGDPRQGTISIEIWKNAFADALKRLCPLQGHDAECGCLPVLSRQVHEHILSQVSLLQGRIALMKNGFVRFLAFSYGEKTRFSRFGLRIAHQFITNKGMNLSCLLLSLIFPSGIGTVWDFRSSQSA
jgi:hypothetical protein